MAEVDTSAPAGPSEEEVVAEFQQVPKGGVNGIWVKDKANSESMDPVLELVKLNAVTRAAISLISGLGVKLDDEEFCFTVIPIPSFPWFGVRSPAITIAATA